ncbi:hypothetical protein SFRURICE_004001 [Spodoptera frugiperda]|nr:hypothetical protein SFRURICE_004001 [Spodoptera frugiperda]
MDLLNFKTTAAAARLKTGVTTTYASEFGVSMGAYNTSKRYKTTNEEQELQLIKIFIYNGSL